VQLTLCSRPLVEALAQWGVVPNKTLTMSWPDHLPAARMPAYIRGYFDGDGTVYQRQRSSPNSTWQETVCRFISGSVLFLDGLEQELTKRGIRTRKRYRNQGSNAHVLPLSGTRQNLLAFASLIYDGSTVALARKQAIFESLRSQPGKERQ
jgi:LAGLIDADG DNA endonuclease family protein